MYSQSEVRNDMAANNILKDSRYAGIEPFESKIWLASPTMHGEEQYWVDDAIRKNWVSTVGANIYEIEKQIAEYIGCRYAVALASGTATLHLATKLAGEKLYSQAMPLDTTSWEKGSIGEITEEDWNFDGIPDLQVCMGPMNGFGNYVYDVWLWNDKTHQFDYLNDCPEIFSPEIDAANQCITSFWRLDDEVEIVKYKWKDGKLVETDREQLSYSEMTED